MSRLRHAMASGALVALVALLASVALAAAPKSGAKKPEGGSAKAAKAKPAKPAAEEATATDAKEGAEETKPEKQEFAAAVNFTVALGLPFESLDTFGSRVDAARKDADPVALGVLAGELMIAEQVSGKQAPLTAETLMTEAVNLAKVRRDPAELKAMALMVKDEPARTELGELAGTAEQEAADRRAAFEAGEKPKDLTGDLAVNNGSHHPVAIYVDGRYVGSVPAHGHRHFHVHSHGHETTLDAIGGGLRWHQHLHGHYHNYQWTLVEHH